MHYGPQIASKYQEGSTFLKVTLTLMSTVSALMNWLTDFGYSQMICGIWDIDY